MSSGRTNRSSTWDGRSQRTSSGMTKSPWVALDLGQADKSPSQSVDQSSARSADQQPVGVSEPPNEQPLANHPQIEMRPVSDLRPYPRNARTHSKAQIRQIADSIERFGFTNPVLISDEGEIIAGHARVEAARLLGFEAVPTLRLSHLSAEERRAYVLADNKLAQNAGWDFEILADELEALIEIDFDVSVAGFSAAEINLTLDQARNGSPSQPEDNQADIILPLESVAVSRLGDLWQLGRHRLLCGDAKSEADLDRLMQRLRCVRVPADHQTGDRVPDLGIDREPETHGDLSPSNRGFAQDTGGDSETEVPVPSNPGVAALLFTDPPYNVPIDGHVGGLGSVRHRDFAEASGEMSEEAFTAFLTTTLQNASRVLKDGAIAYVCMDWRHMGELLAAGKAAFTELKNLCVWNKTNGGMGSLYRSKHELIFVFKHGTAPHTNTFGLGDSGRYRTNVWDHAGINATGRDGLGQSRMDQLAMHPTVKPVDLIEEALKDCSLRGEIILDLFGGSGSTLLAAERCGRSARLMEIDPLYCDTIIRRWQAYTGKQASLLSDGQTFDAVAHDRAAKSSVEDPPSPGAQGTPLPHPATHSPQDGGR